MSRFRNLITRRERRRMLWLFAVPLLVFAALFVRLKQNAAPLFPVPPNTQVLECHWSLVSRLIGPSYVQRVQSSLAPAQFWSRTAPLLKAKGMNPEDVYPSPSTTEAEDRDNLQATFRLFGLTQIPTPAVGCSSSDGHIKRAYYSVYMWPHQGGTIGEFWIRDPLK